MTDKPSATARLQSIIVVLLLLLGACATVALGFGAMARAALLEAQFLQQRDSPPATR